MGGFVGDAMVSPVGIQRPILYVLFPTVAGTAEQDKIAAAEQIGRYLEESTENGSRISFRAGGGAPCLVHATGQLQKLTSRMQASCRVEELPALRMAVSWGGSSNMKSLHEIEKFILSRFEKI
jgi:hypothetical protein